MQHVALPSQPSQSMRMITRPVGFVRQSQNPHPQADPRIFCRRAAPLTPPTRRAPSFALARNAKEIVMSAATAIALLIPLSAGAQQAVLHRLVAETFSLTNANVQSRIWSDRLPTLLSDQKYIQSIAPKADIGLNGMVFQTTFKEGSRTFVVSVLKHGCANTGLDYAQSCPARVVEMVAGEYRLIKEIPDFIISFDPSANGTQTNAQSRYMTIASFNPSAHSIDFADVVDGQQSPSDFKIQLQ
ncbi:MAG: hypothetical protein ACR65Z_07235 [Methylocystis sp.]